MHAFIPTATLSIHVVTGETLDSTTLVEYRSCAGGWAVETVPPYDSGDRMPPVRFVALDESVLIELNEAIRNGADVVFHRVNGLAHLD